MSDAYRIADDVKRVEDLSAALLKTTLVTSLVLVVLAIWVRTPHLAVNPASAAGLSGITGFNVGHAIVFGPWLAFGFACIELMALQKRANLMAAVKTRLEVNPDLAKLLTDGDLQVLGGLTSNEPFAFRWAERIVPFFWCFIVPPVSSYLFLDRYFDFLPNEAAKGWPYWERVGHHLFTIDLWSIQPLFPSSAIESDPLLRKQLPYIYSPLQPWLLIALTIATAAVSWRAAKLFSITITAAVPSPADDDKSADNAVTRSRCEADC